MKTAQVSVQALERTCWWRGKLTPRALLTVSIAVFLAVLGAVKGTDSKENGSFERLNRLLSGGLCIPSSALAAPELLEAVESLGTKRIRLIGLDKRSLKAIGKDGTPEVEWSPEVERVLRMLKERGWSPYVVWGLYAPEPIVRREKNLGAALSSSDWETYEQFTEAMIGHLHQTWRFETIDIEVGNEFDAANRTGTPWFMNQPPRNDVGLCADCLNGYLSLYGHVARVVTRYQASHPDVTIRVGGPGATSASFSEFWRRKPNYINWVCEFVDRALDRNYRVDFVSWHAYGNLGGTDFVSGVRDIQRRLGMHHSTAEIAISEWGLVPNIHGEENREPVAGAFALDFLVIAESLGLEDATFLTLAPGNPRNSIPALFYWKEAGGWSESHVMKALRQLKSVLAGRELRCLTEEPGLGCLASKEGNGSIEVVVWAFDWMKPPGRSSRPASTRLDITVLLEKPAQPKMIERLELNGVEDPSARARVRISGGPEALRLEGLQMRNGDYAMTILR